MTRGPDPANGATLVADPESLQAAYERCRDVTRREARNFYYGLRLTPEPRRSAIYSVYCWMRRADDIVDSGDPHDEKRDRLERFEADTALAFAGEPPSADPDAAPEWAAFAETVRRFGLHEAEFRDVIRGMRDDLEADHDPELRGTPRYAARDDLERYCYRVASTVGVVCVSIWGLGPGADPEEARRLAVTRGLAFQLTNILRDYAEDFGEGRVYLAAEDFDGAGVTPAGLLSWTPAGPCAELVSGVASWARRCYDESAPLDAMIDPACAPALWAMTRIYSDLLDIIERAPARAVLGSRARVPTLRKAAIGVRAVLRARRAPA